MLLLAKSGGRCLGLIVAVTWTLLAGPASAEVQPFDVWLEELRQEALKEGIGAETLSATLTGLTPIERVIELDRRQPEGRFTFQQYNQRVLSEPHRARSRAVS
jgi:membrane-bound lytic murein transglycosylase B